MTAEGVLVWINLGLLVLGLIGGWLYLARRFGALEENFRQGLRSIAAYMESHGRLLGALAEAEIVSAQTLHRIKEPLLEATRDPIGRLLDRLGPGTGNPMTTEEVRRLRDYVARTQQGQPLSLEEAQDFYRLSKKLEGEGRRLTNGRWERSSWWGWLPSYGVSSSRAGRTGKAKGSS